MENTEQLMSEPHGTNEQVKPKQTTSPYRTLIVGVVMPLLLVFLGLIVVIVYGARNASEHPFIVAGSKFFHVPVASIDGMKVVYSDYILDLQALRIYDKKQNQETSPNEVSDRALNRLIMNKLTGRIAGEYGVSLDETEIKQATDTLISQYPSREILEEEMQAGFGWSLDTYIKRITTPSLLEQKLLEKFETEDATIGELHVKEQVQGRHILFKVEKESDRKKVKTVAQKVLRRVKAGEDFAELAKEFGSDETKDKGGDLGWFGRDVMIPEFEKAIFDLKEGELRSELVETPFGYHIVQLDKKRKVLDYREFIKGRLSKAEIEIYGKIHDPFVGAN